MEKNIVKNYINLFSNLTPETINDFDELISKDIIFMDDLRIYVDRGYEAGNWNQRKMYGGDGYEFVEELIGDTHVLVEHHGDQGYLLAFPVDTDQEKIMEIVKQ